jgi:hypothetical protein
MADKAIRPTPPPPRPSQDVEQRGYNGPAPTAVKPAASPAPPPKTTSK